MGLSFSGLRSEFSRHPNKGFFGVYVSGFGACRMLLDVSFIHFVVSSLSQLNRSWAWLTNAPMPQPLSVFGCVVKAKSVHSFRSFIYSLPIQQDCVLPVTRSSVTGTDCRWNCTKPYNGWAIGCRPRSAYDDWDKIHYPFEACYICQRLLIINIGHVSLPSYWKPVFSHHVFLHFPLGHELT